MYHDHDVIHGGTGNFNDAIGPCNQPGTKGIMSYGGLSKGWSFCSKLDFINTYMWKKLSCFEDISGRNVFRMLIIICIIYNILYAL